MENQPENTNVPAENQDGEQFYIQCPKCKKIIDAQAPYCPNCGLEASKMENFGETIIENSKIFNFQDKKFIISAMVAVILFVFIIILLICHYNSKINELEENYTSLEETYYDLKTEYDEYKIKMQTTPTPKPTPTPTSTPAPTTPPQQNVQQSNNTKANKNEVLCGVPCVFSDYKVTYNSFSFSSDYNSNAVIISNLTFENLSSEARPFFTTASVTLYQDGVELEPAYFVDGYDAGLGQRKVQQGGKFDVQEAHVLRNKTSPVYIEITDWISWNGTKYKGVIPLS